MEIEPVLLALIGIFINGIVTGFAVYIGNHGGKRVLDKINQKEDLEKIKKIIEKPKENLTPNIILKEGN